MVVSIIGSTEDLKPIFDIGQSLMRSTLTGIFEFVGSDLFSSEESIQVSQNDK
jgi:hypothetical protein